MSRPVMELRVPAPAKINLTLDVLGRRADGYHDLRMVMQSVDLCDNIYLTREFDREPEIHLFLNGADLPADGSNLCLKAAEAFFTATGAKRFPLDIALEKRIPVCAGTAGGSSDAAAVLRGLNVMCETGLSPAQLAKLGEAVGSDVPYCVLGCTALAEGRGEKLTVLPPMPDCLIVLCKPPFPISTPALFRAIDSVELTHHPDSGEMIAALEAQDLARIAGGLENVFEEALTEEQRAVIQSIRRRLTEAGALGTCMSGSGPTVFGIFPLRLEREAEQIASALEKDYPETFVTMPVQPEE